MSEDVQPDARAAPAATEDQEPAPSPRWFVVLPVFAVLAFLMTFRSVGRLGSHVVGNSGDSVLVLWILGWVQHAIPHGWDAVWNTSMFHPSGNTLAYSESMIPMAILEWPLRILFGPVLGFNILALATQTAALWFMYRLALVLTRDWRAAVVAALAFGFSVPLLAQFGHPQLTLAAFLVPLCLLLLVRFLEGFRRLYAVGLGLALGTLLTSATYYGLMMATGIAVVALGFLIWFRPDRLKRCLVGLAVAAGIAAMITLPVALPYMKVQDDPYFRRGFDPAVAAHFSDFLSPDDSSYLLKEIPPFEGNTFDRTLENRLFPGIVAVGFGVAGIVVLVRAARRPGEARADDEIDEELGPPDDRWRARVALLVVGAGAVSLVLSFGDEISVFGQTVWLPFKVVRKVVPGFSGLRVTSRFVLLAECALALAAAFGVRALLRRLASRVAGAVLVLLCAVVIAETARAVPLVRVPDSLAAEGVGRYLQGRPEGVVAELPIRGTADGAVWAYTESPRLYVSLIDGNDRLNGYSGYTPPGFDEQVPVLNAFPSEESLKILDRRGVRYVVLRTAVVGDQFPVFDDLLGQDGVGRFTPDTARARIAEIPPDRVKKVTRVPGAYVVELRSPR